MLSSPVIVSVPSVFTYILFVDVTFPFSSLTSINWSNVVAGGNVTTLLAVILVYDIT